MDGSCRDKGGGSSRCQIYTNGSIMPVRPAPHTTCRRMDTLSIPISVRHLRVTFLKAGTFKNCRR